MIYGICGGRRWSRGACQAGQGRMADACEAVCLLHAENKNRI